MANTCREAIEAAFANESGVLETSQVLTWIYHRWLRLASAMLSELSGTWLTPSDQLPAAPRDTARAARTTSH
jgi:hypothetical protein